MKYISTRGRTAHHRFSQILLMGLAPDGGLFLPEHYPHIDEQTLYQWRDLSYPELAFQIIKLFADDIPEADLKAIINQTYTTDAFGSETITPLRRLHDGIGILGLSNGPTLAFKDMAMQFLGNTFEYVLSKENKALNIIGATSGDTGSAAEYALRGKNGIHVFMLSPNGKMSAFQRAQMYSLPDANIHNIAIDGMFDDCQDIVKTLQNDELFKEKYQLSTVNSINWGRIAAQIVYYFKGYFAATSSNEEKVSFCVPSGNFGNVCAGHIARMMGLPIHRLIVATNENDVLYEFFKSGYYKPRVAAQTRVTSSPSMDISKASNFERFIFDLVDRDATQTEALWDEIAAGNGFNLHLLLDKIREQYGFVSGKSLHSNRIDTIANVYANDNQIIDPHTADGITVARNLREAGENVVCLETALAAKFADTIAEALGSNINIPRPAVTEGIEDLPQRVQVLPNNAAAVKMYMKEVLNG
ncbi:threonine synthase [Stenoxybacter acetivorans]|uniref:threonine synthase n=1 Tax=Stenoxybacter acetivorans TaxID=422441 RepID=UPI000562D2F2|nr:threonine synthase [Stenoxybacter acetivorans]